MPELMSQAEFLESQGGECPECRSGRIDGQGWHYDGASVWQQVTCDACGGMWREVFNLVRFDDFEKQLELMEGF